MHFPYVVAAFAIAHAALASPQIRAGRPAKGVICRSPKECFYYYTTGSAQCNDGFDRTNLEAKHDPLGSYCQRDCNTNERTSCTHTKCKDYEQQCNLYAKSGPLCSAAIEWCDGPIAMLKDICTSKRMGQPVTYDQATHLCIPKGKTAKSRKALGLRLGPGASFTAEIYDPSVQDGYPQMSCFDISYLDAKTLAKKAASVTGDCTTTLNEDHGNTGFEVLNIKCKTTQSKFKEVEGALQQTCAGFKPFTRGGPYFNSQKFSGQPK